MTDTFARAILDWYHRHGRKDLPWQRDITPYRVWVSEIMLQQTQVNTVLGYFERFLEAFPTVGELADADEDAVLHLWTGLGYYSRARNLHKTARIIREQYQNVFPRDVEVLMTLPGIGRSTAGAIASLAMGIRAAILDGNVKRVLTRYFAIEGHPGSPETNRRLWYEAERLTPERHVNRYTQAMMDLGATLCTRSRPGCLLCPLQQDCRAHQTGRETDYPTRKPHRVLPQKRTVMPILIDPLGRVLLYKRPSRGIWGGLWSLPELAKIEALDDFARQHGLQRQHQQPLEKINHTFSHYQLTIEPWLISIEKASEVMAEAEWLWYNLAQPPGLGLAAPVKKLLEQTKTRLQWQQQSTTGSHTGEPQ